MSRLAKSLERLQPKVMAEIEAEKMDRKEKWDRIKREAPEMADFLKEVTEVFGKPKKVWLKIGEERVL